MFNKFEMFGFAVSIVAMSLALYLLTLETNIVAQVPTDAQQASGIVAVDSNGERTSARANALLDASDTVAGRLNQLVVDDIVVGTGDTVEVGDTVTVHYVGTLQNGQEFDNSNKRGTPFTFTVGEGRVIKGWEDGLVGMQVGGQRILVIPSDLAYGDRGYGPIPGKATLVFAIELLAIE